MGLQISFGFKEKNSVSVASKRKIQGKDLDTNHNKKDTCSYYFWVFNMSYSLFIYII